jgi:uncharacterized membrane protein YeaQ/YmgE (transglycosylase-associated protein family)
MNPVVWLVVGGILGWVASTVMPAHPRRGLAMSIMVGVAGALLGGWLVGSLLSHAPTDSPDVSAIGLVASIAGAIALLAFRNLVRRRTATYSRI